MKKLIYLSLLIVPLFFMSCEEDPADTCSNICQNGGLIQADCSCECLSGFEGPDCEDAIVVDPCDGISCLNGGICNSGTCDCPAGYIGTDCSVFDVAGLYNGDWAAVDNCPSVNYDITYVATLGQDANDATALNITNFSGFGEALVIATSVSGFDITMPYTDPTPNNGVYDVVNGTGTLSADGQTILWNYTVDYGNNTVETCTGTWTKQ